MEEGQSSHVRNMALHRFASSSQSISSLVSFDAANHISPYPLCNFFYHLVNFS